MQFLNMIQHIFDFCLFWNCYTYVLFLLARYLSFIISMHNKIYARNSLTFKLSILASAYEKQSKEKIAIYYTNLVLTT